MKNKSRECTYVRKTLDAFADGELTAGERSRVAVHLGRCAVCVEELRNIRTLSGMLAAMPRVVPMRDLVLKVEQAIDAAVGVSSVEYSSSAARTLPAAHSAAAALPAVRKPMGQRKLQRHGELSSSENAASKPVTRLTIEEFKSSFSLLTVMRVRTAVIFNCLWRGCFNVLNVLWMPSLKCAAYVSATAVFVLGFWASWETSDQFMALFRAARTRSVSPPADCYVASYRPVMSLTSSVHSAGRDSCVNNDDESSSLTEAMGLRTDEDGLYAVEM